MSEPYDAAETGGPYLQVACFCENVVQRTDGVLTLVNIVDRISITRQGPEAPESMPPTPYQLHMVLVLKAGRARGRHEVRFVLETPDGTTKSPSMMSLNFEGPDDGGTAVVQQMVLTLSQEGLNWFNVYLADQLLTKLPLRVVYSRISGGGITPTSG